MGTVTYTFTATDAAGNTSTFTETVQTSTGSPSDFPNASNTGIPAGTVLTNTSDTHLESGTYTAQRWSDMVEVHGNVIIRNSELLGNAQGCIQVRSGSLVMEDCVIGPTNGINGSAAVMWGDFTLRRCNIRNHGDAIRSEDANNILVEDCYMKLVEAPGFHGDGLQGYRGGTNVTMRHCTIDQPDGTIHDGVTANILWSDASADGLTLENNLFLGGGYTVRIHSGGNHVVVGNRIVDGSWRWGPVDTEGATFAQWSDNRLVTIDSNYNVLTTGALVSP